MNLIKVAVILTSTIASSSVVLGSSTASPDLRIDYKIDNINDPQLVDVFAGVPGNISADDFSKEYNKFSNLLRDKLSQATTDLDLQAKGIDEISKVSPFNDYGFTRGPCEYGRIVIDAAKKEWAVRSEACVPLANSYMTKREITNTLKTLSKTRDSSVQYLNRKCFGISLSKCYADNIAKLPKDVAPIKKWIFAQQMFGDPSAMAAWIKPDWKPALQALNAPQDRFSVASIKKDLNLISRWKTNGKNLPAAIATLRANFETIRSRIPASETALKEDFALRKAVLDAMLLTTKEVREIDFDVISRRYKAFERMAEGIARNQQNGIVPTEDQAVQITKAVKAYLMATQMFIQRGFEFGEVVKYAILPVAEGLSLTTMDNNANADDNATVVSTADTIADSTADNNSPASADAVRRNSNDSQASVLDLPEPTRIEYMIEPTALNALTNIFANVAEDANESNRNSYMHVINTIESNLAAAVHREKYKFDDQSKGLGEILRFEATRDEKTGVLSSGPFIYLTHYGDGVVFEKKFELADREAALKALKNSRQLNNRAEITKFIEGLKKEKNTAIAFLNDRCGEQSYSECFKNAMFGLNFGVSPIKKWVFAQQMFNDPAAVAAWIKPDWKPVIQTIDNNGERFVISSTGAKMNFSSILMVAMDRVNQETKALKLAVDNLRMKLDNLATRAEARGTEAFKADVDLRIKVFNAITQTTREAPVLSLGAIARRVKAFELIVEGIARQKQRNTPFSEAQEAQVTKAVKAWLMSTQMFTENGFENEIVSRYATLVDIELPEEAKPVQMQSEPETRGKKSMVGKLFSVFGKGKKSQNQK